MKPRKNKSGGPTLYDESLKIAAARDYLTGNLSYPQVAEKYNVAGGGGSVRWFVKWYQERYELEMNQSNSPPAASTKEKDIKELERQLSDANLKIAALEIMIQIAEQDLGIEIRKKAGTKQ